MEVPLSFKREYDAEELMEYPEENKDAYSDAYEEDDYQDDVFMMEVGNDGEVEGEEDPDFYPDDLLHQEVDTVPSPTELKREGQLEMNSDDAERISIVSYYRTKMEECERIVLSALLYSFGGLPRYTLARLST